MKGKRILEINPRHPLIQQVKDKFEADPENGPNALAKILYETALLESGFPVSGCIPASQGPFCNDRMKSCVLSVHFMHCKCHRPRSMKHAILPCAAMGML